ncbi:uncharacterized protein LOC127834107 [Dreissena polymorpha]|uniref:THD domain-containing protein n=1 Tax=Dreissena polymorpha TaxID=45954 RepID=A0A9D4G3H9_DREPO|nr:uncharacterized protein LOC127834107 [Dreissena polymorpha]XP_052215678.1 uncharacterized protein LOC127834107 [Dreissena polymorpha]KAH3809641.1 hypothetical protein DPMN_138016 [Dreissena polymorpha]
MGNSPSSQRRQPDEADKAVNIIYNPKISTTKQNVDFVDVEEVKTLIPQTTKPTYNKEESAAQDDDWDVLDYETKRESKVESGKTDIEETTKGKNNKKNAEKQIRLRIIFFFILNCALFVLICVTAYYLTNERAPPEPNYKLCLKCEDIRGHPDDPLEHIVETDGTCCLDNNENLKYLVEPYASRWMKMKMHEENATFKVCNNVSRAPTEKPSIKVMGLSHVQPHEHHRLHWNQKHEMAIKPDETLIKYRPDDGQIEIMKTGLYHVYNQVHFKIARGTAYNPAHMGHWVYVKRAGTIEQSEDVLMHNMETECEGPGSEIITSSYLGSDFQLQEGDRLYVKVNKKDTVIPEPHLNYFGVHML